MYYDCYHRSLSLIQLKQLFNPMYVTFIKLKHFHFCTTHYHHSSASSTTSLPNNNSAAHHLFASMLINISQRFSLIACLYVIHFNLFKSHQTMAENKNETRPAVAECIPPINVVVDSTWLEKVVFGDFRIWHILFSGMAIFTGITIVLCCLFRCRIPRTKQEIEADFLRKRITESFRNHLEKIKIDELQGQYDTGNLLPLFKKVELFEEDRIQKNEGFKRRKLTWRQKLKRIFSGKDSVEEFGDKSLDNSKGDGAEYTKMTEEEMETVEKEVEGAKTDTSALNMINDQIAIFGFIGESKKDRKKRIIEEKKAEKAAKKEQKAQEKLEKKLAKQQPRKSIAGSSSSARAKSAKALMELRPDSLEKDQMLWKEQPEMRVSLENGGDSIVIDIENRDDVTHSFALPSFEAEQSALLDSDSKGYQEISLDIPEVVPKKSSLFASRFSFRDTVNKLIFRGKPKQKEELVINIGLVKKDDDGTPPMSPSLVTIPHIECSPPDPFEYAPEHHQQPLEQQHKKRKSKMIKKDSVLAKDESLDRNLLQIPEISKSTKEVNSERKSKEDIEADGKKKRRDEKGKEKLPKTKEKDIKADKHKEKVQPEKSDSLTKYSKVEQTKKTKSKEKTAKPEKDVKFKSDSSKLLLLKRQTNKEDGQSENVKAHEPLEVEKKDRKKSKPKDHEEKELESIDHKTAKELQDKLDKKEKTKQKNVQPELVAVEMKTKSKVKQKDEKIEPLRVEPKKEKGKKKQIEFDNESIEQTKLALRETKEHSSLKSDRRLETFPMVVEEVKTRQRKEKREPNSGRRSPVYDSPKERTKEHHSPKKPHSSKSTSVIITKKEEVTVRSPKAKTVKHSENEVGKEKDFNQMVTSLNEELKGGIDQRQKKHLKRSKTIIEDVIAPQEEKVSRTRSRDEFKKRLSEVLLQRVPVRAKSPQRVVDVTDASSIMSTSVVPQKTPTSYSEGTSFGLIAAKQARHVRIVTKQGTSSSEIEIPVEHVYTQGLSCVHVHSRPGDILGTDEQEALLLEGAQIRHPSPTAPVTISTPPVPRSPTHSTISVVTDNIVKKIVESSPETGENRELTYERSRDVIFDVDKSQPSTSSAGVRAKPKKPEKPSAIQTPTEQSPSRRHRTRDKAKEKKPDED